MFRVFRKSGLIETYLIQLSGDTVKPQNKSGVRRNIDQCSEKLNIYTRNGKKITMFDDTLIFRKSSGIFTLEGDELKR